MAKRLQTFVADVVREEGVSLPEAVEQIEQYAEVTVEKTPSKRLDQIGWWSLGELAKADPVEAEHLWARMADAARQELASGHRAAEVFPAETPWDRARFVAVRSALRDEWQPSGGIEDLLIGTMARAHAGWEYWLGILQHRAAWDDAVRVQARRGDRRVRPS